MRHSRETVKVMRELRAGINYAVSDFVGVDHRSDQITRFKNKIVRLFAEKAQAEQFDLQAFDIEFSSSRDFERDQVRLVGAWKPKTMEAEFVGGPLDGDIREVESLDETITVTVVPAGAAASPFIVAPDREAPRVSLGYVLSGWDDVEHRWIFSPA